MSPSRRVLLGHVGTGVLLGLAGCIADGGDSESTGSPSLPPTSTPQSIEGPPDPEIESTTTPSEYQHVRVYIFVTPVEDEDVVRDAENRIYYEDLPEPKQDEFRRAVSGEEVETTEWNTQPKYVKYEGDWYSVEIVIDQ